MEVIIRKGMREVKQFKLLEDDHILAEFSNLIGCPEALTNKHINLIGAAYLRKYGKKNYFTPFQNLQSVAKQLKNLDQDISSKTRWHFLADIYAKLPNISVNLAMTLLYVFEWAFQKHYTFYGWKPLPFFGPQLVGYSPKKVAEQLKASVEGHYSSANS